MIDTKKSPVNTVIKSIIVDSLKELLMPLKRHDEFI